jgi:hypothetical protein
MTSTYCEWGSLKWRRHERVNLIYDTSRITLNVIKAQNKSVALPSDDNNDFRYVNDNKQTFIHL